MMTDFYGILDGWATEMFLRVHYDNSKKYVSTPKHKKFFSVKLGWKYAFLHSGSSYIKIKGNIRISKNEN